MENVVIAKDRVGFRVVPDAGKHAKAMMDKKLVESDDIAVRPIADGAKRGYAMKPPASQELIDRLRKSDVT